MIVWLVVVFRAVTESVSGVMDFGRYVILSVEEMLLE